MYPCHSSSSIRQPNAKSLIRIRNVSLPDSTHVANLFRPIQADKDRLIHSLRTHNINTLPELRRIERIFSALNAPDTAAPMQNAWIYYVDSHNLLNELRGLTRDYPFSSECLGEAKAMVPRNGNVGGNYCWKVLKWVKDQSLIPRHASLLAAKPAMWGGKKPSAADVQKLATMCTNEWTRALTTLLRHWDANGA
ncbi:MAG: hypothetical protein LQ341_006068 [Variospora aurantia]|nr:MAG: hypothetical protein LQ341_006068 [Variospora aurantia]